MNYLGVASGSLYDVPVCGSLLNACTIYDHPQPCQYSPPLKP